MKFDVIISLRVDAASKEEALNYISDQVVRGQIYNGDRNRANPDLSPLDFAARLTIVAKQFSN